MAWCHALACHEVGVSSALIENALFLYDVRVLVYCTLGISNVYHHNYCVLPVGVRYCELGIEY